MLFLETQRIRPVAAYSPADALQVVTANFSEFCMVQYIEPDLVEIGLDEYLYAKEDIYRYDNTDYFVVVSSYRIETPMFVKRGTNTIYDGPHTKKLENMFYHQYSDGEDNDNLYDNNKQNKPYAGYWRAEKSIFIGLQSSQKQGIEAIDFYFYDDENTILIASYDDEIRRHYREVQLPSGRIKIDVNEELYFIYNPESHSLTGMVNYSNGTSDMLLLVFMD